MSLREDHTSNYAETVKKLSELAGYELALLLSTTVAEARRKRAPTGRTPTWSSAWAAWDAVGGLD